MGVVASDALIFRACAAVDRYFSRAFMLRSAYWRIRAARFPKDRRRWYRVAAREKKRLLNAGVCDSEALRLYCLHLANPKRDERLLRLAQHLAQQSFELPPT